MNRGTSPVVGVVLMAGLTVVLAAVVSTMAFGITTPSDPVDPVVLGATASADGTIELVLRRGSPIDVSEVTVLIAVNGEALDHQPPVPFFAAEGFVSGPTGPFNSASDPVWQVGERASLRVAETNDPDLEAGTTFTVRIVRDGRPIARVDGQVG